MYALGGPYGMSKIDVNQYPNPRLATNPFGSGLPHNEAHNDIPA